MILADLSEARNALLEARLRGVRSVRDSSGESITYKSDSEMASALRALDAEIQRASGSVRSATLRLTTSKGI